MSKQLSDIRAILQGWHLLLPGPGLTPLHSHQCHCLITPCEWRQRGGFGLLKQNSPYYSLLCRTHTHTHTHHPTPKFSECPEHFPSLPELRLPGQNLPGQGCLFHSQRPAPCFFSQGFEGVSGAVTGREKAPGEVTTAKSLVLPHSVSDNGKCSLVF